MSLFDIYYPVTSQFEFVKMGFDQAIDHLKTVYCERGETFAPLPPAPLADHLQRLLPIIKPTATRVLILETKSKWLAFLGNGWHGVSGIYPRDLAARHGAHETVTFTISSKPAIPSYQFQWQPRGPFQEQGRYVAAHMESRWEWHEYGDPLPFEEVDAYSARLKRDRVTPERLVRYAAALGIALDDPQFYSGKALLFGTRPTPNQTVFSERFGKEAYAEAQDRWLASLKRAKDT